MIGSAIEQTHARLEIKHRGAQFYAVLSVHNKTLGISETFNSHAAALLAGKQLMERYENNMQASLYF